MSLVENTSARATRGRVPIFRPALNGVAFEVTVTEATITLGSGAHDMALLSCTSTELDNTEDMMDAPISFTWGQAPRTELFCGYIVAVTEATANKGVLTFTIGLIGATRLMQDSAYPRFWTNKSIPSAIKDLASAGMMGFVSHASPATWKHLAQVDESDWYMSSVLAGRMGWEIYNRYGVVMCYDPRQQFINNGPYCRLFSSPLEDDFQLSEDRRLIEFTPNEISDDTPHAMGVKVAYFTPGSPDSPPALQVATQTGTFKRYRWVANFVIRSAEEAKVYTDAPLSDTDTWQQSAQARMWGDADIYPGMTVDIVTTNTAIYRNKYNGRWLVSKVEHKMDRSSFQTMLGLVRPASDTPITIAPYVPFWTQADKSKPYLTLNDSKWLSSWRATVPTA